MNGLSGLARQEVVRLVTRRRLWLAWLIFAALGVAWMLANRDGVYALPGGHTAPTGPMLAAGALEALASVVLFAPLIFGGTLAEDRAGGLSRLLLGRCGSKVAWVSSKVIGMLVVALGFFGMSGALLGACAAAMAPWDARLLEQTIGLRSPLAARPVELIVLTCLVLAVASTATASLSMLTGLLARSSAVALVVPELALFAAALAAPPALNPYVRATFLGFFAEWNTTGSVAAYWGVALAGAWAGALALALLREE